MKKIIKKVKGKKVLSMLLALIMVVAIASPAFSPIIAKAANTYPVELAFNNLFVFDEWARNKLSTTYGPDPNDGTITTDIEDGSFNLKKTNPDALEGFNSFSWETGKNAASNMNYYMIAVEENTTYEFSYEATNVSNIQGFNVLIFTYDTDGSYIANTPYPATQFGGNSFEFTTGENTGYIQVRFTIPHTGAAEIKVSNIAMCEIETIYSENLFSFSEWANRGQSHLPATSLGFGGGTVDVNPEEESMTLNTNASGSLLLTNFTMSATATDNSAYHTIPVEEGKEYTLAYNLVNADNLPAAVYCQPYIAYYKADGSFITFQNYETPGYGKNNFTFTTPAGTEYIQVVFSLHTVTTVSSITVKDIGVYEDITTVSHKTTPIRKVYTYGNDETYTNLPTPSYIPEGYVFAGWFTEPDGEGQRITPETKVLYGSYTVYSKYEPEVDTLEIASMPTKTVYTKGEKLNTAGLSLKATVDSQVDTDGDGTLETVTRTFNINSGVYCTPEYLNTVGTQTITAHYGGKTVTFPVTVLENDTTDIVVNGAIIEDVEVTNNKYTLNSDATAFNRYKIAYSTDSYVKGIITFENDITEEFFLEPSDNGSFVSLIDNFLDGNTHNYIKSVEFTCLDNELGKFQLKAVSTELKEGIPEIAYFNNNEYEMGIDVRYGGVVSELYDIDDNVVSRVYKDKHYYDGNNPSAYLDKTKTLVDYESQLDKLEAGDQSLVSAKDKNGDSGSNKVNLINTLDRGRYLQQSYYGTDERPYVQGEFNEAPWKYNPVQGGNVGEEPSKVIDYEITDTYVYVKARPMEWEKWSDDHVDVCTHTVPITNANGEIEHRKMHAEKLYGNDVVSDTYVEAWYYFSDGMIKVQNRKVDYSGLPEKETEQEMPALYLIEPLNHYVYNNVSEADAWSKDFDELGDSLQNIEEPEFWGIHKSYSDEHYKNKGLLEGDLDKDNNDIYDAYSICNENWAAFTASEDENSFGVGIYTPGIEKMYYGVMPQIYAQKYNEDGTITETYDPNYRHAETANPSPEMPTSYIAPLKKSVFKSYDPTEYTYYLTTGTAEKIRYDFSLIGDKEAAVELAKAKVAVPETVYMDPANNRNGEFYVNNILNKSDFYNVETEAVSDETDMYFGIHVQDAESFTVNVTNAITSSNDIILGNADGTGNREGETINFDSSLIDSYISEGGFSLRLTNALQPGETATAKWDITVTMKDDSTKTYTAYTVLYAPERTVGAVAEARQVENSQNEISSWITGVNGVNHSQKSPLGSFHGDKSASGYFIDDPLYNENPPTYSTGETANDLINVANDSSGYYVMQTATNGHDSSRAQSYLGLLTVDGSRYTNTNQIPNLKVGYDALRRASGNWHKDTFHTYTNYYALGTIDSFTSTDLAAVPNTSEWIQERYFTNFAENHNIPERYTVVPSYDVSEIDGKYIHALNRSQCIQDFTLYITRRYATAGTSVLCSVTDKSGLRDAVLDGYAQPNDNAEFIEKLENAATILGDPSATQDEIDEARKELTENVTTPYYSLKYDNIFSAYEMSQYPVSMKVVGDKGTVSYNNGTITVVSGNITGGEAYTDYGSANHFYKVALKPNTEYVFEYDVETTLNAQAFMFFYDSNGSGVAPAQQMFVKTNNGGWKTGSAGGAHWGNYTNGAGTYHYAIKFTTGDTTTQAAFRFGNTTNDPCTSTFSNIKLVEADKYYENVEYTKTEAVYKEYEAYGTLPTLSRPGYTFTGWMDEAEENVITGANTAIGHTTIYSQWDIIGYTVTYDANGGDVTPKPQPYTVEDDLTLPTPTREGYTFTGWKVTVADGKWVEDGICSGTVPAGMYGNVTLTAQWNINSFPVLFDTILDFSKWDTKSASNATISNVTDNGFTLTSNPGAGEGTSTSPQFPVTAGKQYYIDIDIADSLASENWDVYIFFYDENTNSGTGIGFTDSGNRFAANGGGNASRTFTAPEGAVKAVIRLDANGASHSVTFSDIRVYEAGTCAWDVNVPESNKVVTYGDTFGTLPVPTRDGYDFVGWFDADSGKKVTAETIVSYTETTTLFSKWEINDTALVADTVVVDFGLPTTANPLANDTVFAKAGSAQTLLGFSTDGGSYSTTLTTDSGTLSVNNGTVTFTPSAIITGETTVYYHASVVIDGETEIIKNQITLAPASNVYYEETLISKGADTGKVPWNVSKGLSSTNAAENTGVYGYDNRYVSSAQFSNNTNYNVSVDSVNKRSETASFTFTGTGFDLIAACGANTGVQLVNIKQDGKLVKGYIVDTYYDTTEENPIVTGENLVYQTPIVNWSGDYGTYTVEITSYYLASAAALQKSSIKNNLIDTGLVMNSAQPKNSAGISEILADAGISADDVELVWFDDNSILNGGTGASATRKASRALDDNGNLVLDNYIDGIRIYNTLNKDSSKYSAEEKNAVYANVVGSLVVPGDEVSGVAYLFGNLGGDLSWETYQQKGPKGEIYLFSGNAVTFKITVNPNEKVMVALRAVNGGTKFNIGSTGSTKTITNVAINSATEMYYDITECIGTDDITEATTVTVTVTNSGDKLLAVNHIKFSGGDGTASNGGITPRSTTRSAAAATQVTADRFLPISVEDIAEAQNSLTKTAVDGIVKDGVVVPLVEEEIPGGDNNEGAEGETPEVPDDGGNEGGDDSSSTEDAFDIFSLLKWIIELIKQILFNTVGNAQLV